MFFHEMSANRTSFRVDEVKVMMGVLGSASRRRRNATCNNLTLMLSKRLAKVRTRTDTIPRGAPFRFYSSFTGCHDLRSAGF